MCREERQARRSPFRHGPLDGWALFWLIVLSMSGWVVLAFARIDTNDPAHISAMIAVSVRLAVPWLFVAFAASSIATLFPGEFSRWMLRNRRIFGLCFAAGMAWQLAFILWLIWGFTGYYIETAYSPYDLAEQVPGYMILFAMTVTSFKFGRRRLTGRQWRVLHKGGIYFLWGVVWSTYWFELYYYDDIQPVDYIYYWAGIGAWGVRVAAWSKKREMRRRRRAAA